MMRAVIFSLLLLAAPTVSVAQTAPPQATASEEQLEVARKISAITVPDGFLRKAYSALMPQILEAATRGRMGNSGFDAAQKADPNFQERMRIASEVATSELSNIVGPYESKIREAYAHAYAAQLSETQLMQVLAFYSTPTGALFAQRVLSMVNDPAIVNVQREIGPAVTEALPGLVEKIKAATAHLPNAAAATAQ